LVLEEKLVELMLKYGDYVLDRKTPENEAYQITVIEEIINHLEEDQCEIISPINQKIIEEIKLGIAQSELRSGNFYDFDGRKYRFKNSRRFSKSL
jgi:DNA primase